MLMNNEQSNNAVWLWMIGIISVIALILAWMAYNRSGENLTTQIEQEGEQIATETGEAANKIGNSVEQTVDNTITAADRTLARAEARAELLAIEAELEVEENYDEAVAKVQSVRADLRNTYANAEASVKAEWREIDTELEQLEQSLRSNSANALETLAGLIILLEEDVRTDEE